MGRYIYIITFLILSLISISAQKNFTVVIDPGHGGKDPGCVGAISKEKTINLAVALQLGSLIEKSHKDVKVIYTRKTDVFIPLDERAGIANKNKADLFISIHVNSARRVSASGTETYTLGLANSTENLDVAMRENSVILMEDDYLQKYEGFDPKSTESYIIFELMQNKHLEQSVLLASQIQKSFVRAKRENRGVRQAGFLVLRKTSMPGVLVELGFISNRAEERYLVSKEGQTTLAQSIYRAFCDYKYDYDRKLGSITNGTNGSVEPAAIAVAELSISPTDGGRDENVNENDDIIPDEKPVAKSDDKSDSIIYKVQILTSDKKIPENDKRFKGYDEISFYIENGIYKYTYGSTSNYTTINSMLKKASKDFKGAFIIRMKNGERINNKK